MTAADIHLSHGTEDPQTRAPLVSLLLAYVAMLPIVAGAGAAALARGSALPARLTSGWAGAVLCFLAGVRRGLSFRQPGGPTVAQLASMLWLFVAGAGALLSPWRVPSLVLLLLGYGSEAVIDPLAARRAEAPRYFARLRPAQMLIPVASLLVLLAVERGRTGRETRR